MTMVMVMVIDAECYPDCNRRISVASFQFSITIALSVVSLTFQESPKNIDFSPPPPVALARLAHPALQPIPRYPNPSSGVLSAFLFPCPKLCSI
jgi:hypothetical protein